MATTHSSPEDRLQQAPAFLTTHWSVVLSANQNDTTQAQHALEKLCRSYWYPIYYFVRRQGHSQHDAQDLTQEFFAQLLEKNWVARVDQSKGRFRSFLLMVLKRFLAGEWRKSQAQKRGGTPSCLPPTMDSAETRYQSDIVDSTTPEQAFEKQWALALLERVMQGLRLEYADDGKAPLFDALKACLMGSRESQPYAQLAEDLQMSVGAVKVAVHRLRSRYRQRLRDEIAQTVAHEEEVDREMKYLIQVLART